MYTEPIDPAERTRLISRAIPHVDHILRNCVKALVTGAEKPRILLLFDDKCEISRILTEAYKSVLLDCEIARLDVPEDVQSVPARIDSMKPNDLVIAIQTSNLYQLNEYRVRKISFSEGKKSHLRFPCQILQLRIELFRRKIKSVDHVHLGIMPPSQYETYIDTLSFDHRQDGPRAHRLKNLVDNAKKIVVTSGFVYVAAKNNVALDPLAD